MSVARGKTYFSMDLISIFLGSMGLWVPRSKRHRLIFKAALTISLYYVLLALVISSELLYGSIAHTFIFDEFLYCLCSIATVILVAAKYMIYLIKRSQFIYVIDFVREKLLYVERNEWDTQMLKIADKRGVLMICIFIFFDQMTTGAYLLTPINENIRRNGSDRVLIFDVNCMMPGDVNALETPLFEILFIMEVCLHTVTVFYLGISYFIFDVTLTVLNIFIVTEFKILQHRLEVLFQPEENPDERHLQCQELIDCIHKQNELIWIVEKMENVFSVVILGQMLMSSLLICVTGYAVMAGTATILKTCLYAAHLMGDCTQLLLITISCNDLMTESSNVSDAIYRSNWYLLPNDYFGKFVRKNVQIIMIRSHKVCYLSAGGFVVVSLQTFTKVMSTAGSYFALLRHFEEQAPAL